MNDLSGTWVALLVLAAVWELVWKGLALWRAGRRHDTVWFVVLLLLNTMGILPIIYLLTHKDEVKK